MTEFDKYIRQGEPDQKEKAAASLPTSMSVAAGQVCPLCGKGTIIRGKTAYGCSEWKNGCSFRHPLD